MQYVAVVQFIAGVILLAVGLGVRFAGSARILNFVEYPRIADVPALHRWVGNRLLLIALSGLTLAIISLRQPQFSIAFACVFMLIFGAVVVWLLVGSAKFSTLGADYSSKPTP